MSRPVAPDLDDNPRIPASWSREDLARELRKERRRCAEEITENRKLRAALKPTDSPSDLERQIHEVRLAAGNNAMTIELCGWLADICTQALKAAELKRSCLDFISNVRTSNIHAGGEVLCDESFRIMERAALTLATAKP